jgi:hypothetical protein
MKAHTDAMRDFAAAQNTWIESWPSGANVLDRALVVDYVKMYKLC